MPQYILALDQGTTSSRSILFDRGGPARRGRRSASSRSLSRAPAGSSTTRRKSGPRRLRRSPRCLRARGATPADVAAIGITNQRETTVLWDRRRARRGARHRLAGSTHRRRCARHMQARGLESEVTRRTGLLLDPYFSGTKLAWLLDNVPGARARAERGELAFGTIDSWLVWKLTRRRGATSRTHPTPAARCCSNLATADVGRVMLEHVAHPARRAAARSCRRSPARDAPIAMLGGARGPDRRHRRRPAGGAVRPGLLRARHGQEHLRHRLLPADEHRQQRRSPRPTAC